jgi:hypothetical protein
VRASNLPTMVNSSRILSCRHGTPITHMVSSGTHPVRPLLNLSTEFGLAPHLLLSTIPREFSLAVDGLNLLFVTHLNFYSLVSKNSVFFLQLIFLHNIFLIYLSPLSVPPKLGPVSRNCSGTLAFTSLVSSRKTLMIKV